MSAPSWLRYSVQIAHTERTRSRRQPGQSSTCRAVLVVVLIGFSIGGWTRRVRYRPVVASWGNHAAAGRHV